MRDLGDVSNEMTAALRPVARRPVLVAGAAVLVLGAVFAFAALRGPAPTGLAATGWDPPVILAVDPSSPDWSFLSITYSGDGRSATLIEPSGLLPPVSAYSLRYEARSPIIGHRPVLVLDLFEVADLADLGDIDSPPHPTQEGAAASPRRAVQVRGQPASATAVPDTDVATVAWWEDEVTLVRLTLRTVPSISALAAGHQPVPPTVDQAVAAADALVEISRDEWLDLERLTEERRAAAEAVQGTVPEGPAGPATTMIGG